jgi:HSP20 family molecular chaperone IbpA
VSSQSVRTQPKREATEEHSRPGRTYVPDVDICESPEAYRIWADLPGVDESSVDVHLEQGVLAISGRVSLEDYAGLDPVCTEHNIGNFDRRFRLSSEIDPAGIRARMVEGVLELELPKASRARPRRIPIQGA